MKIAWLGGWWQLGNSTKFAFHFRLCYTQKKNIAKECAQTPNGVCALSFMDEKVTTLETSELFQEGARGGVGRDVEAEKL